jgi:hypothetical protein
MEKYKQIKEHPKYLISNLGNVKNSRGWVLTPCKNVKGNYVTYFIKLTNGKKKYIHRLVAEHFVKNPLNKNEVNHKDNNPHNNIFSNLEWVTHYDNMQHAKKTGRIAQGEKAGLAKLKEYQVKDILTKKMTYKEYAKKYNISSRNIHAIWAKTLWRYISK